MRACKRALMNIRGETSPDCRRHAWLVQNCKLGGADGWGSCGGSLTFLTQIFTAEIFFFLNETQRPDKSHLHHWTEKIGCNRCLCNLELKTAQINTPARKCSQLVDWYHNNSDNSSSSLAPAQLLARLVAQPPPVSSILYLRSTVARRDLTVVVSSTDKTVKLWKISERDKRPEGYNLKDEDGRIRSPSTITSLRVRDHLKLSGQFQPKKVTVVQAWFGEKYKISIFIFGFG